MSLALQVPPGSYLLEVFDTQRIWPAVKIDVSAKQAGKLRALMTHNRLPLPLPLPIEPLVGAPSFFEKREGFKVSRQHCTSSIARAALHQ